MFYSCNELTSLNLTNFNSKLEQMKEMFAGCSSLLNLLIPNIDTSLITNMDSLFQGCSQLTSLDITNFETKNVKSMEYIFSGCASLI